ncbi:hypothetical protein ACI2S3_02870 [Ralstonia nicotianae]
MDKIDEFLSKMPDLIANMEAEAKLLGDQKLRRDIAKLKRLHERKAAEMPAIRAAADARDRKALQDLIEGLEQRLAAGGAHE